MTPRKIVFTRHAEDMLAERRIERTWVESTVRETENVESDPTKPNLLRAYRRIPERSGLWLRVVYEPVDDVMKIVTMFFDRGYRP
jgi:hypothetical protein